MLSMVGIYELKPQLNILLQLTSGHTTYNWRACSQARFGMRCSLLSLSSPKVYSIKKKEGVLLIFLGRGEGRARHCF